MALETGTFVSDLQQTNPPGTDKKKQGDDHLRLIKTVLRNTFPNASRAQYFARSRAVAASGGIAATDMAATIAADATAGVVSLSLPTLTSGDDGFVVTVVKSDVSVNLVTMTGTVNGVSGFSLTRQFEAGMFIWGGTAWFGVRLRPFIVTGDLQANSVTDTVLRDSNALSVIGRSVNSVGDPGDIIAASDGLVLLRSGVTLTFGQVAAAGITDGIITPTKMSLEGRAFQGALYHIRDERGSGTDGDLLTVNSYQTRTLQTEKQDDLGITTSSNVMALQNGTYWAEVVATTEFTGNASQGATQSCMSKLRLRNTTDGATLCHGMGVRYQGQDDGGGNIQQMDFSLSAFISDRFVISGGPKNVELQNFTFNALVSGQTTRGGKAISSGENEVYADVRLYKIG